MGGESIALSHDPRCLQCRAEKSVLDWLATSLCHGSSRFRPCGGDLYSTPIGIMNHAVLAGCEAAELVERYPCSDVCAQRLFVRSCQRP